MNVRAVCEGGFTLPMTVEEALPLFTPEGERGWAGADWDPQYPIDGAAADDSAPGTVFTTESHGGARVRIRSVHGKLARRDPQRRSVAAPAPDIGGTQCSST